ncbi:MAG: RIP metalloprotease RseP [Bacteroidaceae bacterium]|nr:RIP metalloprotease RseP [Bacteroidaceae bacterium]
MLEIIIQGGQLITALSLLVVLHEGGHFLFAKLFKTRVEKFYLFFDYKFSIFSTYSNWFRKLIGKKPVAKNDKGEYEYEGTEYGIGWIPLGGYVKISGMIDESMDTEQMNKDPQPWEFRTKPAWQRLFIMLGGVIMNFITAFVIYAMVLFTWGRSYVKTTDMEYGLYFSQAAKDDGFRDGDIIIKIDDEIVKTWNAGKNLQDISNAKTVTVLRQGKEIVLDMPKDMSLLDMLDQEPIYAEPILPMVIDSVLDNTPAKKAGIKAGDCITSINNKEVKNYNEFRYQTLLLQDNLTDQSTHSDSLKQRTVTLIKNGTDTIKTVLDANFEFGIYPKYPYEDKITTVKYGFFESFPEGVKLGWEKIVSYVDQLKYLFTSKGVRSVGGFIGIGKIFAPVWDWQLFWMMTAFLSVALGVMNLLPIPALDGGHALITCFEMVTGKKPNDKWLEKIQIVGMWLLLALMLWANLNDILRLFGI